jgi:hypothetical protein
MYLNRYRRQICVGLLGRSANKRFVIFVRIFKGNHDSKKKYGKWGNRRRLTSGGCDGETRTETGESIPGDCERGQQFFFSQISSTIEHQIEIEQILPRGQAK